MLSLINMASMLEALSGPLHPVLRHLIVDRMAQLDDDVTGELGDLVHIVVVEPGDTLSVIEEALGFHILDNLVDGVRFGYPGFMPSWEWIADHGSWFELVYVLSDDGFGVVVYVKDDPGIEFDVHAMCQHYAERPIYPVHGGC
jgi:hypothetical protein